MVYFRDIGVGRHDLNPQNSGLFLRFKSDARLACSEPVEGISRKDPYFWMNTIWLQMIDLLKSKLVVHIPNSAASKRE
jgi:hypothetical protein